METFDRPTKITERPKVEKINTPSLTKREMKFIKQGKNLLISPVIFEGMLSSKFIELLNTTISQPGLVYKIINLRADKHVHKILIQKIRERFKIIFIDDNSNNSCEEYIISITITNKSQSISVDKLIVTNKEIIKESESENKSRVLAEGVISDFLERDIGSAIDDRYINDVPEVEKPIAIKFFDPTGKYSRTWKKPLS